MRKFVEDEIEIKFDSPIHVIQSAACLIVTAPFKFIMTISGKILYLPKEAQQKVMLNSAIVASIVLGCNVAFQLYFNCFSLFRGRLPIVVLSAVVALLWVGYCVVGAVDLSFHSQLETVIAGEAEPEAAENTEQTESTDGGESSGEELSASELEGDAEDQFIDELLNLDLTEEKEERPDFADFKRIVTIEKIENGNGLLSDKELEDLKEDLEACVDPSKFLSEQLLVKFRLDKIVEDNDNLDSLNLGVIPNGFKAFA